ncbi:hypothetical protein ACLMAB_17265 [Brevibacillus laterosporus]
MFKHPTIAELAPWIQTSQALIEQGTVEGEVMLTPIQKHSLKKIRNSRIILIRIRYCTARMAGTKMRSRRYLKK